ncbi:MAG: hypothetical protein K2J75_03400, partial [Clostridia bacterium]|nr:hypothetical protein [Clostridia bacterium]
YISITNICGDDCVYVSENFFYENNLDIPTPTNIDFYSTRRDLSNTFSVEGTNYVYKGRAKELAYSFMTSSNKNEQLENCAITVKCDPVNIEKLKNKQKYDEYVYGVETKDILKDNNSEIMVYCCIYVIDFKRNENTSKKCQLTMEISIEHDKDMPTDNYKERCDKLFYSLLDNVVYRNV